MFGFSLSKLLVLALIVGAVLVGFRLFGRMANQGGDKGGNQAPGGPAAGKAEPNAFDTEYDAETDSYVVRDKNAARD